MNLQFLLQLFLLSQLKCFEMFLKTLFIKDQIISTKFVNIHVPKLKSLISINNCEKMHWIK
jgi:hypothetical protein